MNIWIKYIYLTLFFISSNFTIRAQDFLWASSIKSNNATTKLSLISSSLDHDGNLINIGTFSGSADFDPGISVYNLVGNSTGNDVFIQKLDIAGNLIWAKKISGPNSTVDCKKVSCDINNNIFLVGNFDDTTDFDPNISIANNKTPVGIKDAFIEKLDSSGNLIWIKTIGSTTSTMECNTIQIDAFGDLIIGGSFNDLVDFDPNSAVQYMSTFGSSNPYLLKMSNSGNYQWSNSFSGSGYGTITSITIDANNLIYTAGNYIGNLDFNSGIGINSFTSKNNSNDIFFTKLTISGQYISANTFGGSSEETVKGISLGLNNNVLIAGEFEGVCDFDPSFNNVLYTSTANSTDCYVVSFDNNLNYQWVKIFGGSSDDKLNGINSDYLNNLYLLGSFGGSVDFDPSTNNLIVNSNGNSDMYLLKLDANGGFFKINKIGSTSSDEGNALVVDGLFSIYSSGIFNNSVDFDPSSAGTYNLVSNNSVDGNLFSTKWSQCNPDITNLYVSGCNVNVNGQNYTSNGNYYQNYTNVVGCDSFININVDGGASNTIINASLCNGSYTFNNQVYSTSGTYIQHYLNAAGCDSNFTLNVSINTPTYKTINDYGCVFYFWNNLLIYNSGTYIDTFVNAAGCDSIVTLNLTINQTIFTTIFDTTCMPIVYNGNLCSSSGVYHNIFTTPFGCDSIVDYDLTIIPIPNTVFNDTVCRNLFFNGQNYASTGTYYQQYINSSGCDSSVVLNLYVNSINKTITQNSGSGSLISNHPQPATYQWFNCSTNPLTLISGAISPAYYPTTNGNFGVIINSNGCTDTSNCTSFVYDNIAENKIELAKIYPNPAHDILNLESLATNSNLSIKIISLSGQILLETNVKNQRKIEIPITNLSQGVYFIKIKNEEHTNYLKFIKD